VKNQPSLDALYAHAPDAAWRRIEDESVVLDLRTGAYWSLNDTASVIWETIGEGLPPARAVERLCAEFEVTEAAAARDASEAVARLLSEGLIRRAGG
jgi:hypothetical protein